MLKSRAPLSKSYKISEFADLMGVVPKTVHRWIAAGTLHAHRVNRLVRISEEDARAFMALHRH
jgi:excisionase family DNA binding protein